MTGSDPLTDKLVIDRGRSNTVAPCADVLIAARDRADTIERAVQSALTQPEVSTVIVVDDGSTDDTLARAVKCDPHGKRLIVERLNLSAGPSAARNVAIEISKSPWLAILDGDDFILPGRIGKLLSLSADWDFIADDPLQIAEDRIGHEAQILHRSGRSGRIWRIRDRADAASSKRSLQLKPPPIAERVPAAELRQIAQILPELECARDPWLQRRGLGRERQPQTRSAVDIKPLDRLRPSGAGKTSPDENTAREGQENRSKPHSCCSPLAVRHRHLPKSRWLTARAA